MKKWYSKNTGCGNQAIIADEETGESVAIAYKSENGQLLAAAPKLLKTCKEALMYVQEAEQKVMRRAIIDYLYEAIQEAEEVEREN